MPTEGFSSCFGLGKVHVAGHCPCMISRSSGGSSSLVSQTFSSNIQTLTTSFVQTPMRPSNDPKLSPVALSLHIYQILSINLLDPQTVKLNLYLIFSSTSSLHCHNAAFPPLSASHPSTLGCSFPTGTKYLPAPSCTTFGLVAQ